MPIFNYRVRDRKGNPVEGRIEAPTLQVAGDQLHHLGYLPIELEEVKGEAFHLSDFWNRWKKIKLEELTVFSQQLSTLYKAGLPLLTGLESLKEQTENPLFKKILTDVCRDIQEGSSLYMALSKHPQAFSTIYVNMIRAGETSGRLGESLDRFITLAERELKTRQRIKEATRYPKIVLLSLLIAFGVLITFVIPRFAGIFAQFKTPLPLPTRIMIQINTLFQQYWYLIVLFLLGIPFLINHYLRTTQGRTLWHRIRIRIPLFGPLFQKIALSKFAYTFVMLYKSGIPILQSLEITSPTVEDTLLEASIGFIQKKVREGKSFTEALRETKRFTPLVIQMVSVGESSGTLDEMFLRITEYYDIEVENLIKRLSTYIEPALTLVLGVAVLFLALAVFLPWWNLASLFRG